jgi:hypothetical protein
MFCSSFVKVTIVKFVLVFFDDYNGLYYLFIEIISSRVMSVIINNPFFSKLEI